MARLLRAGSDGSAGVAEFSRLGEHGAIWFAIGGAMVLFGPAGRRGDWRHATGRVGVAYAVNTALKLVIRRRRPAGGRVATMTDLSFPSAHAATSFAGARGFARAGAPGPAVYALAAGLAWSRLRLGVHHPSDVLAGALLGLAIAGSGR